MSRELVPLLDIENEIFDINPRRKHLNANTLRAFPSLADSFIIPQAGGRCGTHGELVTRFAQNCRCRAPVAGSLSHGALLWEDVY